MAAFTREAFRGIRSRTEPPAGDKAPARMRKPAAIGVASLGVVAGRIVGQELHAYWRLHRVTRALAIPAEDATDPGEKSGPR